MIDFDELERKDRLATPGGDMSRSGSVKSLPADRPAPGHGGGGGGGGGMSRSGSATSLTGSPKVPDHAKSGSLRHSQYQRQTQDPAKSFKRDLDAAVQGVREEMKLFLAQQKLSLQQDFQRSLAPLSEELQRLAEQGPPQRRGDGQDAALRDLVVALQEKVARTDGALALLDKRQRALEDRVEDEMTEVTKGMAKLSDDVEPLKLADGAMGRLARLEQDFKASQRHSDKAAAWATQQEQLEQELRDVKADVARLGERCEHPLKLAADALGGPEEVQAEVHAPRQHQDEAGSHCQKSPQVDKDKLGKSGKRESRDKRFADELSACVQGVREELERSLAEQRLELQREIREAAAALGRAPAAPADAEEAGTGQPGNESLQREVRALEGHTDELAAHSKQMEKELERTLAEQRLELQREIREAVAALGQAAAGPAGAGEAAPTVGTVSLQQIVLRQERFEEDLKEVKGVLERVAEQVQKIPDSVGSGQPGSESLQQEVRALRSHADELAAHSRQMEKDFADSATSMREELIRLTELTVGCFGKAKDIPSDLESLRRDVTALQERSMGRSLEGTATPVSEFSAMEAVGLEQEDLSRALAMVRKELLRAKDLFLSGQKSAGVVLSDVAILKQDLQALKDARPAPGDDSVEQLRNSLRQELADEFRSLADAWTPRGGS